MLLSIPTLHLSACGALTLNLSPCFYKAVDNEDWDDEYTRSSIELGANIMKRQLRRHGEFHGPVTPQHPPMTPLTSGLENTPPVPDAREEAHERPNNREEVLGTVGATGIQRLHPDIKPKYKNGQPLCYRNGRTAYEEWTDVEALFDCYICHLILFSAMYPLSGQRESRVPVSHTSQWCRPS